MSPCSVSSLVSDATLQGHFLTFFLRIPSRRVDVLPGRFHSTTAARLCKGPWRRLGNGGVVNVYVAYVYEGMRHHELVAENV